MSDQDRKAAAHRRAPNQSFSALCACVTSSTHLRRNLRSFALNCEGMRFVHRAVLQGSESNCRTDGNGVTLGPVGIAKQQVALREMLAIWCGVTLRYCE